MRGNSVSRPLMVGMMSDFPTPLKNIFSSDWRLSSIKKNSIGDLDHIAEWAAFHHEKLDDSGYPFHIQSERINTGARIMAVAGIFTALCEDRPYRKRMEGKQIEAIMKSQIENNALDKKIVNLLIENFEEISSHVFEMKFSNIMINNYNA